MLSVSSKRRFILLYGDVALLIIATKSAQWIRFGRYYDIFDVETGASLFTTLLYLVMAYVFDIYNLKRLKYGNDILIRTLLVVITAGFFAMALFYSFPQWKFGRGIFLIQMASAWILLLFWRVCFRFLFIDRQEKEKVLIIGAGYSAKDLYNLMQEPLSPYQVVGFLDDKPEDQIELLPGMVIKGQIHQLADVANQHNVNTAIIAVTRNRPQKMMQNILEARLKGVRIQEAPQIYEELEGRIPVEHISDEWLLFADGFNLISNYYLWQFKRLNDFWVSLGLFIAALPLMCITALLIKLETPGPVLFRQKRVGLGGQPFTIWKFRSMREDAEKTGAVWAQKNDPRITYVGKWIRLLRIDELPQLYNVVKGDMSLIGPRPERPEFVEELLLQIPYYGIRHTVRPGITGWAQVSFSYGASVEDAKKKLEYDLFYIKNMSFFLDMNILLKTIGVVLFGEGAR